MTRSFGVVDRTTHGLFGIDIAKLYFSHFHHIRYPSAWSSEKASRWLAEHVIIGQMMPIRRLALSDGQVQGRHY
jgi:hypothetical protein